MEKTELKGQASDAQIADWKKEHEGLFAIKVGGHIAYLKKPDRKTLSYCNSVGKTDMIKYNETLLNNCFVGGSEEVKTDDKLFYGASGQLLKIIEVAEAELEKL